MKRILSLILFASAAAAQSPDRQTSQNQSMPSQGADHQQQTSGGKKKGSVKGDVGGGTANIGEGAAKGTGHAAKGAAEGVGDAVTLHPVEAGKSVGDGAVSAGKDVTVGTAKGTGKITRGVGRAFKKIF